MLVISKFSNVVQQIIQRSEGMSEAGGRWGIARRAGKEGGQGWEGGQTGRGVDALPIWDVAYQSLSALPSWDGRL